MRLTVEQCRTVERELSEDFGFVVPLTMGLESAAEIGYRLGFEAAREAAARMIDDDYGASPPGLLEARIRALVPGGEK